MANLVVTRPHAPEVGGSILTLVKLLCYNTSVCSLIVWVKYFVFTILIVISLLSDICVNTSLLGTESDQWFANLFIYQLYG